MQVSVYQHTYATFCGVWLNFSILLQKSQWVLYILLRKKNGPHKTLSCVRADEWRARSYLLPLLLLEEYRGVMLKVL